MDIISDYEIDFVFKDEYCGEKSRVVIYVEPNGFTDENDRIFNYKAMYSARLLLQVYYDEKLKNEMENAIYTGSKKLLRKREENKIENH